MCGISFDTSVQSKLMYFYVVTICRKDAYCLCLNLNRFYKM